MCLDYGNRPAELGKRDSRGSARLTDLKITLLDVVPDLASNQSLKCRKISSIRRRNPSTGTFPISAGSRWARSFATNSNPGSLE
jgi:hypothetical protein